MAKTIKFNLILDNQPVRTIDELRENFSIEDMLKYFKNGFLLRWLKVRKYEEYQAVAAIDSSLPNKDIVISLINIFNIPDVDIADVEEVASMIEYQEQTTKLNEVYAENAFDKKQIIEDYHAGYDNLILHMEENSRNVGILKADVLQIEKEYAKLFALNYYDLYYRLLRSAPKAISIMITKELFKKYWVDEGANEKIRQSIMLEEYIISEFTYDELIQHMEKNSNNMPILKTDVLQIEKRYFNQFTSDYSYLSSLCYAAPKAIFAMLTRNSFREYLIGDKANDDIKNRIENYLLDENLLELHLGSDLKRYSKNTLGSWVQIESPNVKIMVLSNIGSAIRSPGSDKTFWHTDIQKSLPIFDGIDYRSTSNFCELLYMEV
ncbi:hypothetical protein H5991_01765 [Ligilactobacillus agilis]|uniref:hypothetical protein n=1 Tax=Ligilactobacillus agilis TaxID=1601 RepID=UPI00195C0AF0|nr:hypothetical protein [Ligilactobacillus agilis]MBM6772250.1 hypothetical protein [Ligilactobacillus agilis]